MKTDKQSKVAKLNEIAEKIQEAYFDIQEFNGLDTGNSTKSKLLDALDGIGTIRRKLLTEDQNKEDGKTD